MNTRLQGANLWTAEFQGALLRGASLWRALVSSRQLNLAASAAQWNLADLTEFDVESMAGSEIDALVSQTRDGIPDERRREMATERLTRGLRTANRPPRPDFPQEWQSKPNVMFKPGDPAPDGFDWGQSKWATDNSYDRDLASFLGDLACGHDVPEAQIRGLAWRADLAADFEPHRVWPLLFAERLTGPECPSARGLPDNLRHHLEQLAARDDTSTVAPETSPP